MRIFPTCAITKIIAHLSMGVNVLTLNKYMISLLILSFPIGPDEMSLPTFVYIIIGVAIFVFLLFLCTFLVFLSKHLHRRWQIQNSFKVREKKKT